MGKWERKEKKEGKKKKKHSQHAQSFTPENTNKQVAHLEIALSQSFSCLFSRVTHRKEHVRVQMWLCTMIVKCCFV